MAVLRHMVSKDANEYLHEFSAAFATSLVTSEVTEWAKNIGLYYASKALRVTFPIPLSAAGYRKREGDDRYRRLFERSLHVTFEPWQDGFMVEAAKIEAPDFIGFSREPSMMARAAKRHPNKMVAAMLEANPLLDLYEDRDAGIASTINLFHAAHPVSVIDSSLGTQGNILSISGTAGFNVETVDAWNHHFANVKDASGEVMGLQLTHVLVPPGRKVAAEKFFNTNTVVVNVSGASDVVGAVTQENPYYKAVQVVVGESLTDTDDVFPIANNGELSPWVLHDTGDPETSLFDKSDHMYKTKGLVGMNSVLQVGVKAALPHGIARHTLD